MLADAAPEITRTTLERAFGGGAKEAAAREAQG